MGLFGGSSKSSVSTTQIHNDNKKDNRRYSDNRKSSRSYSDSRRFVDRRSDSRSYSDSRQTHTTIDNTAVEAGGINAKGAVTITDGGIAANAFEFADNTTGSALDFGKDFTSEAFDFASAVTKDLNNSVKDVIAGQRSSTDAIVDKTLNNTAGTLAATGQRNMLMLMGVVGVLALGMMWLGSR